MSLSGAQYVGNLTYFAGVLCRHIIGMYLVSFKCTDILEKSELGSILIMGKCKFSDVKGKPRFVSHIIILLSSAP